MEQVKKRIPAILLAGIIAVAFAFAIGAFTAQEAYATELSGSGTDQDPYKISNYEELKKFATIVNDGQYGAWAILTKDIYCTDKKWVPIGSVGTYNGTFNGDHKTIHNLSNEETGAGKDCQGLFGEIHRGEVKNVGVVGGKIIGKNHVGAVVGQIGGKITNCYNTGAVSGDGDVGGLAGALEDQPGTSSTITNCYNTGAVSGCSAVGGLAGVNFRSTITNSYNTGTISGNSMVGGVAGDSSGRITNCYFDNTFSVVFNAIGDGPTGETVKGLATNQMIGTTALDKGNMVFSYTGSEQSPWIVNANGKDENSGTYYSYYPHLKGFAYDSTKSAADWPAKLTTSVDWRGVEASYPYNGSPQGPTVTKVTMSQKPVKVPSGMTAEWRSKTVDESSGDPMWSNPPACDEPNTSGAYWLKIKDGDKVIEEMVYIILRKEAYGKLNDYTVRYQVQQKTAGGGTKWSEIDPKNIVGPKQYKVVVRLADSTVLEEKAFQIIRPLTITAPTASAITYGQTLKDSKLTGGVAKEKGTEVAGTFTWNKPKTVPAVSDSNRTEYDVTFTPADTENYDLHATKVTVPVNKAAITIKADSKSSKYGKSLKKLTYKVSGSYVKGDKLGVRLSTTAKKNKPGTYAIKVSWNKNPNYKATLVNGKYKVTGAPSEKVSGILISRLKSKGKRRLVLTWNKIHGAQGYDIFFARCGKTAPKKVKTIKGNKTFRWTKKILRKKTAYKAVVKAYVIKNGKKTYVRTSPMVHAYTSGGKVRYTNAKSVTVKKTAVSLKKGRTFKIKARVNKLQKGKKLMPECHTPKLRYISSNRKIAAVSKSGRITAKSKGSCRVCVISASGAGRTIKVTVR